MKLSGTGHRLVRYVVIAVLGVVTAAAVVVDVPTAMRGLAAALGVLVVVRLLDNSPDSPLRVRGRTADVLLMIAAAVVLVVLAPAGELA